ncbi:Hypothetical_protein [Hexamita inflata]|uniref:Hypothetical_protein n=1 Tax=Hexamita inflata TaxID=28002 RepID=A0AA86RFU2_9EUKA|nr:Hypothetical protein HINF_LOCUS59124 [Hexamita inflata]
MISNSQIIKCVPIHQYWSSFFFNLTITSQLQNELNDHLTYISQQKKDCQHLLISGAHTKIVEDDIQEDIQCCKQNLIQKKTVSQQLQTANQQYFKDRLYMFYQPLW